MNFHISPGFGLTASNAETLSQTAAQTERTRQTVEASFDPRKNDFPAKLTAYDSGTGFYTWTRRAFGNETVRYDHPGPAMLSGDATQHPARTPNGEVIDVTSPVDVWLRPVGMSSTYGMVHEVITFPSSVTTVGSSGSATFAFNDPYASVLTLGAAGTYFIFGQAIGIANLGTSTAAYVQFTASPNLPSPATCYLWATPAGLPINYGHCEPSFTVVSTVDSAVVSAKAVMYTYPFSDGSVTVSLYSLKLS